MTNSRIQIEPTFAPKITSAPRNQKTMFWWCKFMTWLTSMCSWLCNHSMWYHPPLVRRKSCAFILAQNSNLQFFDRLLQPPLLPFSNLPLYNTSWLWFYTRHIMIPVWYCCVYCHIIASLIVIYCNDISSVMVSFSLCLAKITSRFSHSQHFRCSAPTG